MSIDKSNELEGNDRRDDGGDADAESAELCDPGY